MRQAKRNNWLAAGRRWRKTSLCMTLAVETALSGKRALWTAPTYDQAYLGWEEAYKACQSLVDAKVVQFNQSRMKVLFPNGGVITFRSLEKPDNARGFTSDIIILDEAGHRGLDERAYYEVLRPMLLDTHGIFWAIGTPDGMTWFWRELMKAESGEDKDSVAWRVPTFGCEISTIDGISTLKRKPHPLENNSGAITFEDMKREFDVMPERSFKQEYLAEFLEDAGGVFHGVTACNKYPPKNVEYSPTSTYQMGLDVARSNDFTVISIIETRTLRQVYFDRFNECSWEKIYNSAERAAKQYNARVIMDATGVGDPPFEELRNRGLNVYPFKFSSKSKRQIMDNLSSLIEHQKIGLQNIPIQTAELIAYQYTKSETGNIGMSAPTGMHDDTVTALAMACFEQQKYNSGMEIPAFTNISEFVNAEW
jgi:hypothetical protein